MLAFADPWAFLLLGVPLLVRLLPARRQAAGAALVVPQGIGARLALGRGRSSGSAMPWLLPVLLWASLVTAMTGPRLLQPNPALPVSGRDLVLALDLSGSMVRKDFELNGQTVSRLDALKHAATEFVLRRGGDRVALILFGSRSYVATPPTHDVRAVAAAIAEAQIGISGRATGISDALGLALKRLRESEARARVIILLSDGVHNSGPVKPRSAAVLARDLGVKVHTIAMGPRDLANADGERDAVDTVTLQAIAELSGGSYFRVKTTDDLVAVTDAIDRLEAIVADGPEALIEQSLWPWPAGLAALLSLAIALPGLRP